MCGRMFILYVHDDAGGTIILNRAVAILHSCIEKIRKECEPVALADLLDPTQTSNEAVQLARLLHKCILKVGALPKSESRAPKIRVTGPQVQGHGPSLHQEEARRKSSPHGHGPQMPSKQVNGRPHKTQCVSSMLASRKDKL